MSFGLTTKSIDFTNPVNASRVASINFSGLVKKAYLVNLDTQEEYKFLFNPTEIKKPPIEAVYEKLNVAFRSHPKYQYKYTDQAAWTFSLYLHSTSSGSQNVLNLLSISRNINNDLSFLESLVYPLEGKGIKNRRPPRCRFVWPSIANTPVIVLSVGTTYKKFNFQLQQMITMVDIVLAENPDKSMTSNMVRERGKTGQPGLLGAITDKIPGVGALAEAAGKLF